MAVIMLSFEIVTPYFFASSESSAQESVGNKLTAFSIVDSYF